MRRNLLVFICAICFSNSIYAQFWHENFENNNKYTVTLGGEGNDGIRDYFQRTDGSNINIKYENVTGFFFAGQDIDDANTTGWTSASPSQLTWAGIDIKGKSQIEFSLNIASMATAKIDNNDYVIFEYAIDNGEWVKFLAFENDGTQYNTFFLEDTNLDGNGEGAQLTSTFATFSKQFIVSGDSLALRVTVALDAGEEDIAFDELKLTESTGNLNPVISEISYSPVNPITSATDVVVSAKVVDPEGVLRTVNLNWGYASDGISNTITMVKGENDIFSATIPAQPDDSTIFFKLYASDNDNGEAFSGVDSYTVFDPKTAVLPYLQTFDANLGDFYSYSASGDTKKWGFSNGYALMNGFNSGELERDFLISPSFDFTTTLNEVISFKTWRKFGTEDNADKYLKLMYSTNYAGVGDATAATWTEVPGVTMASSNEVWTKTEDVDVSMISGTNVRFAFVYNYATDYVLWEVDSIQITGIPNTSALNQHQNNGLRIIQSSNTIHVVSNLGFDIQLYSVTGTLLFQQTNINKSIEINNLSRGIYIVKAIHRDNHTVVKKIIVNN